MVSDTVNYKTTGKYLLYNVREGIPRNGFSSLALLDPILLFNRENNKFTTCAQYLGVSAEGAAAASAAALARP